ncbi:Cytochrome b561 and DOMON domain-containing protein At5g35735 [Euphorbia peplus]|nr:Cytochrome b561 and DOMON domain-containing protein At5g35735 [Euphorbia peplus]
MTMDGKVLAALLCFCSIVICVSGQTTTCKLYRFSGNQTFQSCSDLSLVSSFIHWTYNPISMTFEVAIRKTGTSNTSWLVWSLKSKLGWQQALVVFHNSAGVPTAYTQQIDQNSSTFQVSNIRAEYENNTNGMILFATLHLHNNTLIKITNQICLEEGPTPRTNFTMLPLNQTCSVVDFSTRVSITNMKKKNVHGVLNMVSWGIMLPVGALFANAVKALEADFPPLIWLRILWGASTYAIGVAGWATGMQLGNGSHGAHRILGTLLFCFSTLQFFNTPPPYVTIVISIINIYQGLDILQPDSEWKQMYTGFLIFMGCMYVLFGILLCLCGICIVDFPSSEDRTKRTANGSVPNNNNASVPLLA